MLSASTVAHEEAGLVQGVVDAAASVGGKEQKNHDEDEQGVSEEGEDGGGSSGSGVPLQGEDVIPTAIVIKNIPFAIKKEQLLGVIAKMDLPLPYAFNYHFDNGVFRGLAFANFTTTEETTQVVESLNGKEIGGRRLRVEYKKMLPQAERERIEREKREKRGQLEEQHRSVSNVSLQSINKISSSSVIAGGSSNTQLFNSFVNGQSGGNGSTAQSLASPSMSSQILSAQNNSHSMSVSKQQAPVSVTERYYAPLPSIMNLPLPPQQLDFNDPDILEIYSQLLLFKDREKLYHELAYPIGLSASQKRIINVLCSFLGLVEVYDPSFIIIRRKTLDHVALQSHLQQQGQMTIMQPLQASSTGGSLQRSQSYTSVLQAHAAATVAAAAQQQRQQPQQKQQGHHHHHHQQVQHHHHQHSQGSQQQQSPSQPQPPPSPGEIFLQPISPYENLSVAQQQQQHLRPQGTNPLLQNRIPSGYTASHTPSSSLLRQHGVSPPQNQVPMNSNSSSRISNLLYNPTTLAQPTASALHNDARFQPGLHPIDANVTANNGNTSNSTAPLVPQNTDGSVHSNYSLHSIHDYVQLTSAGNTADINALEDGLTRSLSGLDLGKRNV
ncbi:Pin4p Ecym_4705 [Eremothecium cymbalariae DBVPG|uniref:RRM domain-containing protein n=1 Tax=Eremothecium cymbalariae (strain CBS 270.75 / DBVPG 7215 / KCTC 17166 / NRRL Y-17582) TaxID=931890 RepID=G8JSK3_ERECY|nr:hypothetical protein Ecym_4705 [Eremothecium cymbalariae DBVPG\